MKKKLLFSDLPPLPPVAPPPIGEELAAMTRPFLLVKLAFQKEYISRFDAWEYWERFLIVHWVIKLRFNSKHRIPLRKEANLIATQGAIYADVFRACERLHSFHDGYRNAAHWFGLILCERRVQGLNLGTKARTLKGIRKENSLLSECKNPFEKERFPHTYRLFELLTHYSEKNDIFRKEVFEPFKKSRKAWATDYHKNPEWQVGISEGGKEFRQVSGRGSGRSELPPLCSSEEVKNYLFSGTITQSGLQTLKVSCEVSEKSV